MNPDAADKSPAAGQRLEARRVTFVYTLFHHLGDFVVMSGLLRKFDLLEVEFESLIVHQNSPHVPLFAGKTEGRFFNVATLGGFLALLRKLRRQKKEGRIIFGLPMATGSIQAHFFFQFLKKLGALTYIVDFNLINADIITPPRRRYIFDRHLAQAAELLKHPDWLDDTVMPLGIACDASEKNRAVSRIGFYPESARAWLPEFQWPESRWLELAETILKNPRCEIALIGRDNVFSELEKLFRLRLPKEMHSHFVSLPCTSVGEMVQALQSLDFLVTVNTSALHVAHALKIPLVALCGSSLEVWRPEGDHVRIVPDTEAPLPPSDKYGHDSLQPSLQHIGVAEVHEAFLDLAKNFPIKS